MPNPVTIEKRKVDGSVKRVFHGDLVDEDEHGWLTVYHDSARHQNFKDGRPTQPPPYVVYYLSMRLPLTVSFYFGALGGLLEVQADAALPATISGRTIAFTDLDLDVVVAPGGSSYVRDHETFELHRTSMSYTEGHVAAAHEGIRLAQELLANRSFPFDGSPARVLGRMLAAEGLL
ncbi:MAG: DUF402 domain-containing protein [Chloroflexi bacterium]|nr:DUF402 domain-containing protein [Chloroflexota bacterium]